MCLLTFLPPGVMPDCAALLNGALTNNDGHGFAIVANVNLIVRRGMDAAELVDAFDQLRHQYPAGPALFHSRFTTHGNTSLDNCHPFPVGGDPRTVLAHNGILPSVVQPAKGDVRSDTRIAAEEFLTTFGSLRVRRTRLRLERWMAAHNKMVILTVDRRFRERAYILNETSGIWHDGIWYSNHGYLPWDDEPMRRQTTTRCDWPPPDDPAWTLDRCACCRSIIDLAEAVCPYCGWCVDCGEQEDDCQCYQPFRWSTSRSTAGRLGQSD
jgi:glutamine amidotransferase